MNGADVAILTAVAGGQSAAATAVVRAWRMSSELRARRRVQAVEVARAARRAESVASEDR